MPLVKWTEEDRLGHEEIDAQHEALGAAFNELHELVLSGGTPERFDAALGKVLDQLRTHFSTEAKLMAEAAYSQIGLHLDEHRTYLDRLEDLRRAATHSDASAIAETFFLLRDWFVAHTRKDDRALAEHLSAYQKRGR
ncbi:MAG: hemerythrin domain-containing protein [Deltaproteobacteria bacterium]|nr:hemerythrin domain-containing protein [Deltaproteobacteria bacterium]